MTLKRPWNVLFPYRYRSIVQLLGNSQVVAAQSHDINDPSGCQFKVLTDRRSINRSSIVRSYINTTKTETRGDSIYLSYKPSFFPLPTSQWSFGGRADYKECYDRAICRSNVGSHLHNLGLQSCNPMNNLRYHSPEK